MSRFPITEKTEITRLPKRGEYDKEAVYAILDEAMFCTLAYVRNEQPFQIPTGFSTGEWKATMLLSFNIAEASAKVRTGPPIDDDEDYELDIWAGVVPLKTERKTPIPDVDLKHDVPLPNYLK